MTQHRSTAQAGFTLIEVLVASAILIAVIGTVLQLFSSGLDRMVRASRHARLIVAERQIADALRFENPAVKPEGEGRVEGLRYRWRARPVTSFRPVLSGGETTSRKAALFDVAVRIALPDGERAFHLRRVGWR